MRLDPCQQIVENVPRRCAPAPCGQDRDLISRAGNHVVGNEPRIAADALHLAAEPMTLQLGSIGIETARI
jgi:hypothetical protein